MRFSSAKEVVPDDTVDRAEPVAPADLLALGIGAPVVRDADLVDAHAQLGDLRGDLGLEAETVLLDRDRLDHLAPEGLVAGLHVGKVQVGEHGVKKREHAVADAVPEVEYTVRL